MRDATLQTCPSRSEGTTRQAIGCSLNPGLLQEPLQTRARWRSSGLDAWSTGTRHHLDVVADVLYCRRVRARVRREGTPFVTVKNGFSGILTVIRPGEIEVSARHVPAFLARILGVHYIFAADALTVTEAEVGSLGTRLDSEPCLILEGSHGKHHVELAVRPIDGDLEAFRRALREAGTHF